MSEYTEYLVGKLNDYKTSESWESLVSSVNGIEIDEIYDVGRFQITSPTSNALVLVYERGTLEEPYNVGGTIWRRVVNMSIDIRVGHKGDYKLIRQLVLRVVRKECGESADVVSVASPTIGEKKYYMRVIRETELSDKMKKMWRTVIDIEMWTIQEVV